MRTDEQVAIEINRISLYRRRLQRIAMGLLIIGVLATLALLLVALLPLIAGAVAAAGIVVASLSTVLFGIAIGFLVASVISFVVAITLANKKATLETNLNEKAAEHNLDKATVHDLNTQTISASIQTLIAANSDTLAAVYVGELNQDTPEDLIKSSRKVAAKIEIITAVINENNAVLPDLLSNPELPGKLLLSLGDSLEALQRRHASLQDIQAVLSSRISHPSEAGALKLRDTSDEAAPVLAAAQAAEAQIAAEAEIAAEAARAAAKALAAAEAARVAAEAQRAAEAEIAAEAARAAAKALAAAEAQRATEAVRVATKALAAAKAAQVAAEAQIAADAAMKIAAELITSYTTLYSTYPQGAEWKTPVWRSLEGTSDTDFDMRQLKLQQHKILLAAIGSMDKLKELKTRIDEHIRHINGLTNKPTNFEALKACATQLNILITRDSVDLPLLKKLLKRAIGEEEMEALQGGNLSPKASDAGSLKGLSKALEELKEEHYTPERMSPARAAISSSSTKHIRAAKDVEGPVLRDGNNIPLPPSFKPNA